MRFNWLALLASFGLAAALHESDVGVVDWHKRHVGVPLISSPSTAPIFHRVGQKNTKSVIVTATDQNVLAALNPVDGSVAWRHIYQAGDNIIAFHKHDGVVASLSGPGGAILRLFDVLDGSLFLEKQLHVPNDRLLREPVDMSTPILVVDSGILTLTNGHTVHSFSKAGDLKWTWDAQDPTELIVYSKLIYTPSTLYVVGLSRSYSSLKLYVTSLSVETGQVIASVVVPSNIPDGPSGVIALSQNEAVRLAWIEQGHLKTIYLTPALKEKPISVKGTTYRELIDIGLSTSGHMVAVKFDGIAHLFKLEKEGASLTQIWEFDGSASPRNTDSIYAGGFDKGGNVYVARLYYSLAFSFASAEILAPHLSSGKGMLAGFSFPFDTNNHGTIKHFAIDAANPNQFTVLGRLCLSTSTGTVQLWQQDKHVWTREESLSSIKVAEFVELPEQAISSSHDGDATYIERVLRHMSDAQDFPRYLLNFVRRFATGSYASASSSAAVKNEEKGILSRDTFGFRQIILAATAYGKVFALDSSNGDILWSKILDLTWAAEVGGVHIPMKMFTTRTVSDGEAPQAVLVIQKNANNGLVDTVLFHFDVLTGKDARSDVEASPLLQGTDIPDASLEAFMVYRDSRVIFSLDKSLQAHLYPDTPESREMLSNASSALHFPLQTTIEGRCMITGHHLSASPHSGRLVAQPTWTLSLPEEEEIVSVIPASHGAIASIGKVLGNRTTLYKYLNPRLFVLLTSSHSVSPASCGVYLIDGAKGTIVYHAAIPVNSGPCDVKAVLTENWLVYHYYDDDFRATGQTKSYRMVSVELYEGSKVDDKTRSSEMSAFSQGNLAMRYFEQTYVFPYAITAIGTTSTKYGISSKDLIVATANHKIHSFPRRMLNPRRPKRKPTTEEMEEQLVQYDALLPDDPRRVLSHNYEVANVKQILTSPALLESTSLVFAHGLDLFLTRVAPSKTFDVLSENFNKVQLVCTVIGLGVAIMVTKPIVRNKKLREKWYNS